MLSAGVDTQILKGAPLAHKEQALKLKNYIRGEAVVPLKIKSGVESGIKYIC